MHFLPDVWLPCEVCGGKRYNAATLRVRCRDLNIADVILHADHGIDLGPEGGADGGRIVAEGPPEKVARCAASHTGKLISSALAGNSEKAD